MSSKADEKAAAKAAKDAAKAERAAERAAAKADREEARAEGKEKIAALKEKVAGDKLPADASAADIVDILADPDATAMLKLKASGQINKDKPLYFNNREVFHARYGEMLENGGNINGITNLIVQEDPKVLVPFVSVFAEALVDTLKQQTNLSILHELAKKFPSDVFPHLDNLVSNGLCKGSSSRNRPIIMDIAMCCKAITSVKDAHTKVFNCIIKVMEMFPDDNAALNHGMEQISNMKEVLAKDTLSAKMPFLEQCKNANIVIFTTLQDFLAGRSLEKVATKVDEHEERLNKHEAWLKDQEERLNTLAKNFDLSQEQMSEMTEKISNLAGSDEQTAAMLSMLDEINSVMQDQVGAKREEAELEAVLATDPYNRAFYNSFRSELTATYLAAKSVQTDIVKNSKTGDVGAVGDVLQAASSYIPVIGAGVAFFGAVLGAVDANMQSKMVKRYADLAVDTEEMNQISRGLASLLIKHLDRESINKPESLMDTCKGLLSFGMDVVGGNLGDGGSVGEVAANTAANYAEGAAQDAAADAIGSLDFKQFFGKKSKPAKSAAQSEAEESKAQGADDAGVVANVIISLVYSGKVNHDSLKERLVFLQRYALTEFGNESAAAAMPSDSIVSGVFSGISSAISSVTGSSAPVKQQVVISDDEESEDERLPSGGVAAKVEELHPQQETWSGVLTATEVIVATATLNKPNPMGMAKSRQLILTNGPRLFYCDAKTKEVKGTVEWTESSPPEFKKIDSSTFEFVVKDRTYKFIDSSNGAEFWNEKLTWVIETPARVAKEKAELEAAKKRRREREARNKNRAERRAAQQPNGGKAGKPAASTSTGSSTPAGATAAAPHAQTDAPQGCCTIS